MRNMLAVALLLAACGGGSVDRLLGAQCDDDRDCEERCLGPSNEFPEGMCSYSCDADEDCPSDAWCADSNSGVCLFHCEVDRDCEFLGRDWVCRERNAREDGNRKVDVCVGR